MTFAISVAHNNARLAGTVAYADTGLDPSRIQFYDTAQPAFGAAPGGTPLAEAVLAKPCGAVVANALVLDQADPAGDLITATGVAVWARWVNGNGDVVADGAVTDAAGAGPFKVAGTSGTTLYAGARIIIGVTTLT